MGRHTAALPKCFSPANPPPPCPAFDCTLLAPKQLASGNLAGGVQALAALPPRLSTCLPLSRRLSRRPYSARHLLSGFVEPVVTPPLNPTERGIASGARASAEGSDSAVASAGSTADFPTRSTIAGAQSEVSGGGEGAAGAWREGLGRVSGALAWHVGPCLLMPASSPRPAPPRPPQATGTHAATSAETEGNSMTSSSKTSTSGQAAGSKGAKVTSSAQSTTTPNIATATGACGAL